MDSDDDNAFCLVRREKRRIQKIFVTGNERSFGFDRQREHGAGFDAFGHERDVMPFLLEKLGDASMEIFVDEKFQPWSIRQRG